MRISRGNPPVPMRMRRSTSPCCPRRTASSGYTIRDWILLRRRAVPGPPGDPSAAWPGSRAAVTGPEESRGDPSGDGPGEDKRGPAGPGLPRAGSVIPEPTGAPGTTAFGRGALAAGGGVSLAVCRAAPEGVEAFSGGPTGARRGTARLRDFRIDGGGTGRFAAGCPSPVALTRRTSTTPRRGPAVPPPPSAIKAKIARRWAVADQNTGQRIREAAFPAMFAFVAGMPSVPPLSRLSFRS